MDCVSMNATLSSLHGRYDMMFFYILACMWIALLMEVVVIIKLVKLERAFADDFIRVGEEVEIEGVVTPATADGAPGSDAEVDDEDEGPPALEEVDKKKDK